MNHTACFHNTHAEFLALIRDKFFHSKCAEVMSINPTLIYYSASTLGQVILLKTEDCNDKLSENSVFRPYWSKIQSNESIKTIKKRPQSTWIKIKNELPRDTYSQQVNWKTATGNFVNYNCDILRLFTSIVDIVLIGHS